MQMPRRSCVGGQPSSRADGNRSSAVPARLPSEALGGRTRGGMVAIRDDAAERMPRHSMSLHPFQSAKIIDEHTVNAALLLKPEEAENFSHHPSMERRRFHSNNELWEAVIREQIRATPTAIHLESFFLFEWFPRSPGLYYTPEGNRARREAQEHVEGINKGVVVYDPYGKMSMLDGGVGNLRFRPITIRDTEFFLMSASSTGICHQGFPVALPASIFEKIVDEINERGCLVTSLIGRLRFLPVNLGKLYHRYREVPQLYLDVEELRRPTHPKSRSIEELRVSVAVSFHSRYEGQGRVYATYVSFDPSVPQSFSESIEWLEEDYVVGKYKGKILTDFDEQRGHFPDAPFSLGKIMDLNLRLEELTPLDQSTGVNPWAILRRQDQIIVEVYVDAKYKFTGNNQRFGVVGDHTQVGETVDLAELKEELSRLLEEARKYAKTPEQDMAVGEIARAEGAASGGDKVGALSHLKAAGAWVLGVAEKIGANLAAALIKESLGLH